jgi:hypothetical protein
MLSERAAANKGNGSSRGALIAQRASRCSSLSEAKKASASASWTSASVGTLDRRHYGKGTTQKHSCIFGRRGMTCLS